MTDTSHYITIYITVESAIIYMSFESYWHVTSIYFHYDHDDKAIKYLKYWQNNHGIKAHKIEYHVFDIYIIYYLENMIFT